MDSPAAPSAASPDLCSPGGKSRYGRTRRPKLSRDFYNTDDVVIDETPPPRSSPLKSPRLKPPPKSPIAPGTAIHLNDDFADNEFTQLDDLGMKVASNFKSSLQRGLDDTIKERKFFKSIAEKVDLPNVVDVTKVLKLISSKPAVAEAKSTPKTVLKTYSNRRKHPSESFIVESFGLPDEPIVPVRSPLHIERDTKIDMEANCEIDVNLVNPWGFEEFDPVPLYASEPITTLDEIHFNRGGMLNVCALDTNFEKSRIPTPVKEDKCEEEVPVISVKKVEESSVVCEKSLDANINKNLIHSVEIKKVTNVKEKNKSVGKKNEQKTASPSRKTLKKSGTIEKDVSKILDKKTPLVKEAEVEKPLPSRILRSSIDNNNIEAKKDPSSVENTTAKQFLTLRKFKSKNQVINPVKLSSDICSPQVRVILNPLCMQKYNESKKLVPNPFKIKREKSKLREIQRRKMKLRSCKVTVKVANTLSEALPGISKIHLKKTSPMKINNGDEKIVVKEEIDLKSIKTELVDFQPGDLAWAKIGNHPYWPCMVTQEPISADHKKIVANRSHPFYHVRFFGDKGRRSWVKAQHVMLFYGRNDLEMLAKVLKAENKVKRSYIKQSYTIKPTKLSKWESGVREAEALKCRPLQDRLNYFFELFASKREKEQKLKSLEELDIKQEILDDYLKPEDEDNLIGGKKRVRQSEGNEVSKRMKFDCEVKQEEDVKIEEEIYEKKKSKRSTGSRKEEMEKESHRKKTSKTSFSSEISDLGSSPEVRKKLSKKSSRESIEMVVSPEAKRLRSAEKESPKKIQKNSVGEVEIFTSPEGRKRITRQSQLTDLNKTNEDKTFKTPLSKRAEVKSSSSCSEDGEDKLLRKAIVKESSQSPEKRKRGKKPPEDQPNDDNVPPASTETPEESPKSSRKNRENENEPHQTPDRRRSQNKEEELDDSLKARKKLRSHQSKPEIPDNAQEQRKDAQEVFGKDAQEAPKVAKRNSTEEEEPKALKNKRHLVLGDISNSDTDSKFSDNSSVPASLESQAALFRRNHIFRGIPREKVCQVCEEGGEVFKCKGPCNGVYHYKCAIDESKKKESDEEKRRKKKEEVEIVESETVSNDKEKSNVEIISVDSKKPLPSLGDSPNIKGMTLAEKIDFRMKEIMKKFDYQSVYAESTDSGSEEFVADESFEKYKSQSKLSLTVTNKPSKKEIPIIKHVTADNISYICVTNEKPKEKDIATTPEIKENLQSSKCHWCSTGDTPRCLICNSEESKAGSKFRQKCSIHQCGKYYHPECLKMWPQTQWSLIQSTKDAKSDATYATFVCPRHVCHTCISDDPRAASNSRCPSDKVVKCLRCPATYHSSNYCVPAGSHLLSTSQIVCPRHYSKRHKKRMQQTINTNWCFICSKGGDLICCETCPTSVHVECLPGDLNEDETFFCEDCQSGRMPLYDEIVWVKLGSFRWWPALILFPNEVPDNVRNIAHNRGEFVVKFYGTYDHYWVGRGRTFLFQEGDKGHSHSIRKRVDNAFAKAIEEAAAAHQLKKQFKLTKVAEKSSGLKPPPYIKIKGNKPVGNVRLFDGNTSNTTSCECDPNQPHPCGPDSDCLNRLLLTECNPEVCPAGERCNNQCFEKREYPPLVPHRTQVRGWGLKTLAPIRKGQFVIEYVGEIIDEQEYQRRIQKMHEQKEENYYFLTIDKDRTLDAGPKGNVARFMNHSCQPNCETQKWTVNGDTRVGLFAKCDIPADTELTFNYNLECIGKEKKICKCGAPNCSGFIGVKVKPDGTKKSSKPKKKKTPQPEPEIVVNENPCFVCGKVGDVGACNNKICTKFYHLECVGLATWPEGGKWICQWHNCNFCSKRTIRCCIKCLNSFCPPHSQGTIRYDKQLGFVCFEHDPKKETTVTSNVATIDACASTDVKEEGAKADDVENDLDSMSLSMRLNGCVTSTPLKKTRDESSQDENRTKTKRKSKSRKSKRKSHVKNAVGLSNQKQSEKPEKSEVKKSSLNRTDPDRNLPIRKRNRLRCGNTL